MNSTNGSSGKLLKNQSAANSFLIEDGNDDGLEEEEGEGEDEGDEGDEDEATTVLKSDRNGAMMA